MFVLGLAMVAAFGSAAAVFHLGVATYRRRKATLAAQGVGMSAANLALWRLRNGFPAFAPAGRALLKNGRVAFFFNQLVFLLETRGITATSESLATTALALVVAVGLVTGLATASPVAAIAIPACLCAVAVFSVGNALDRRQESARESIPAALESMAACFGSGFTLQQTFQQVAADVDEPLAGTFRRAAHILEMGGGADRALEELRRDSCAAELSFIAVALDVQHQSGGAMRQVLQAATETVKGELSLRRSLRVQTAQAKLSARIVAVMPFVLVSAFSLASPDFLLPFFQSIQGYALLALAVLMQVAGIVLVRRALIVEGVS